MKWRYGGKTEQRKAAIKRRADAHRLAAQGPDHLRGAMYLGGYAIECKIKAIAMERYDCDSLDELRQSRSLTEDEVYSHGLGGIRKAAAPDGNV